MELMAKQGNKKLLTALDSGEFLTVELIRGGMQVSPSRLTEQWYPISEDHLYSLLSQSFLTEKANIHRDRYGKYTVRQKAVPLKIFRAFLRELYEKFGNSGVRDIMALYDSDATDFPSGSYYKKADYPVEEPERDTYYLMKPVQLQQLDRLYDHVKYAIENSSPVEPVDWIPPRDFHITLVYAKSVNQLAANSLIENLKEFNPVPLHVNGFGTFPPHEPDGKHVLYLNVVKTDELKALQNKMYEFMRGHILELSNFSVPENWNPHITLAYSSIPFQNIPEIGGTTVTDTKLQLSIELEDNMYMIVDQIKPPIAREAVPIPL